MAIAPAGFRFPARELPPRERIARMIGDERARVEFYDLDSKLRIEGEERPGMVSITSDLLIRLLNSVASEVVEKEEARRDEETWREITKREARGYERMRRAADLARDKLREALVAIESFRVANGETTVSEEETGFARPDIVEHIGAHGSYPVADAEQMTTMRALALALDEADRILGSAYHTT